MEGARLLVVEDEFLLLLELENLLTEAGAVEIATSRTVSDGVALLMDGEIDAAILDVRIGRDSVAPIARVLAARGTPFLFYTGQSSDDAAMAEWRNRPVLSKPALPQAIVAAVAELLPH